MSGIGEVKAWGHNNCQVRVLDKQEDHMVWIRYNGCKKRGKAKMVQHAPLVPWRILIKDKDTTNNTGVCPSSP